MKKKIAVTGIIMLICGLMLTGCKSLDYKKAVELEQSESYEEAKAVFAGLGDYKDSADHLKECENRLSYAEGIELQDKEQYEDAAKIFGGLGEFLDSKERYTFCSDMNDAISQFASAKEALEKKNAELDAVLKEAGEVAYSEAKALDDTLRPELETVISDAKSLKMSVPSMPGKAEEIREEAEKMNSVDYSESIAAVSSARDSLEYSMKQYSLVDEPEEAYVIRCLKTVPGVLEIAAATEDNDPNGNLGKAGAYYAAIYFTHENVDQEEVSRKGPTIIEKGTDGGGQIEVYHTAEDAEKRNNYLGGYDGTVLASGSHMVIGTIVVRTSDELKASQQRELQEAIVAALTKVE